jgi:hypothetical protein
VTDAQRYALVQKALAELEQTKTGYSPHGTHWKPALTALHTLEQDLKPAPVPALGPVWVGGKSVLLHDLTHRTTGIPLYPAFDDAFNQGRVVIAPEPLVVAKKLSSANPGEAFYAEGRSKIDWWFGHLDRNHPLGTRFAKGDAVGRVAANTVGGGPHVHVGINVERLLGPGKQLWHHTDYTHGAPTVGAQLRKALA